MPLCFGKLQGLQRDSSLLSFRRYHEFSPPSADRGVPWKAIYGLDHIPEPLLELCPLTSTRQRENSHTQFAHNNGVHDKVSFVRGQPVDNRS